MNEPVLEKEVLEKIKKVLASYPIERAVIIGSRARGTPQKGSDIDLVIFAENLSFSQYLKLMAELDELNLPYEIDLIKYDLIKDKEFLEKIKREGREIYRKSN